VSLAPGTVVDRYKVSEQIGSGAMGEVFLATDEGLHRKVAVKILLEAHRQNAELRARFVREARAVAAISHPNVVQVFTTGDFDGRPFIAMEYLSGQDLGTIVKSVGPLDSLAAADALLDAAQGLEAAARAGLIHRDVKPSNLVRLDSGGVKVTDFGLAKPVDRTNDPALTAMGVVVGTPDYIAPEQARGDDIDSRVDVYALGCTLFFLLVGRPPFRKGIDAEDKYLKVVARHLRDPAPDPRKDAPDTDDDLARLCLAMMSKSADERPTYPELIAKLEKIRARLALAPPEPAGGSAASRRNSPTRSYPSGEQQESLRSAVGFVPPSGVNRLLWVLTAICLAVFAAGVVVYWRSGRGTQAAAPPPADAAPPAPIDAGPPTPPPIPPTPDGMLLVPAIGGKPAFFVDRTVVTNTDYKALIRSHQFKKGDKDKPVTGIPFDYASSFARLKGKRLLRVDEWPRALAADGFTPPGMKLWEWLDDGNETPADRPVARAPSGQARRGKAGDKSTTFRLAQDL
jgi:eukaryotic-like serine/threonine-protein kinase